MHALGRLPADITLGRIMQDGEYLFARQHVTGTMPVQDITPPSANITLERIMLGGEYLFPAPVTGQPARLRGVIIRGVHSSDQRTYDVPGFLYPDARQCVSAPDSPVTPFDFNPIPIQGVPPMRSREVAAPPMRSHFSGATS